MKTHLYLVRHAHSVYTPDEHGRPLSEKGQKDVDKVTEQLINEGIDDVVSSPYLRAVQTVEGIAAAIGKPVHKMEELKERKLMDGSARHFEEAITKLWENPDFSWEGGESNHKARYRGVQGIQTLLEQYQGRRIVAGTHGNIMVLIMNFFHERYDFEFWKKLSMPDIYKLSFENGRLIDCCRVWMDEE
ncbi:histidine phosphatase family protein [Halobacillus litoralis]|uniref:histidine phosphatase family protein n=1 Tax=Halobacillus litoralis TaxID=45668 RepID=UPI00136F9F74|nr:histidine phosphatase family protein [Halobacillus litoralis]MYL39164.1 histidine phosphatase family protein [Halobacillus litoralis]